jgi:transposase
MTAKKQRRTYTASFKFKVALDALDEKITLSALGERHGIHPSLVRQWKKVLVENSHRLFEDSYQTAIIMPLIST